MSTPSTAPKTSVAERLSANDLVGLLRARHVDRSKQNTALLVLHLNRSDRLYALSQQPDAKAVLVEVSRRLRGRLRAVDRYAFVTPDEVWVLLCDIPNASLAELGARTLRETLMRPVQIETANGSKRMVQMRPVVGGCFASGERVADPMTVVNAAAESAVRARTNDDHVLLSHLNTDSAIVHRDTLERELRAALYGNELEVFFQPQVDIATGHCISAEALIRWFRADGSSVSPDLIASICEERGMMANLTQFVINSSLRNMMTWQAMGIEIGMGINLSAVTLADSSFPALVAQSLDTWGIAAERVTLELTESSIVQHELSAIEFMSELKSLGCKLAIDDFGTGYSSFSYLRKFPLDELKIDKSFVRNIAQDKGDRQIVAALVDLAHTFEMHAIAEGIEDREALGVLENLRCDVGQGYYFSRPIAADAFLTWYLEHQANLADCATSD
ncbi:MAG: EAL domain-containing protein [Burkholderiaceae bacterium]